jgi:hypothetical protein
MTLPNAQTSERSGNVDFAVIPILILIEINVSCDGCRRGITLLQREQK